MSEMEKLNFGFKLGAGLPGEVRLPQLCFWVSGLILANWDPGWGHWERQGQCLCPGKPCTQN